MRLLSSVSGFEDVTFGDDCPPEVLSPDVVASLHRDAVLLKRGELIFVVPVVVLGLFGAAAIVLVPRSVTSLGYPTCAALVGVGRWVRDWYRLERSQS